MLSGKYVRPQITAGDSAIGGTLDSGPPFGTNGRTVLEPIRDELLAGFVLPALPESGREAGLGAPSSSNGPLQNGSPLPDNRVVFLHGRRKDSTRNLVGVNKTSCLAKDKGACTVVRMSVARKKPQPAPARPKRKRMAEPVKGPDGLTMSQRLFQLMAEKQVGQTELARMCSQYYTAFVPGADPDIVKQQHIFNIIQGQSNSWVVPLIAAVFEVNEMWLQLGIGPKHKKPRAD